MADPKNPGQFGNRPDTKEQARKGAARQPIEAKRRGGQHSHLNR